MVTFFRDEVEDIIMAVPTLYICGQRGLRGDLAKTVDVLGTWRSGPPSSCSEKCQSCPGI